MMAIPVPAKLHGIDEDGAALTFWGNLNNVSFELFDPIRRIKTFDFGFKDIDADPFPATVIANSQAMFQSKAAVSAHVNATRVFDFYKSILLRDGIDDKGMDLISAINCTYPNHEHPPEWRNAVWYDNRMWYGQVALTNGGFQSFSRYLDVIAHELTHGVTEYTANLIYRNESGALNESFSDIFGIIIKNWYLKDPDSGAHWNWKLGCGLGHLGRPLRDLSDPTRTHDPAHMNHYVKTFSDNGGVHTNSNIHNKAAYNLMTAKDSSENYIFTPREAATLYYLALTRLSRTADFSARTYYAGDSSELAAKSEAIDSASLMRSSIPQYTPISMTHVLLFAEERSYVDYASVVWSAMIEAEHFYASAGLVRECRRFACLPGTTPTLHDDLPSVEQAALRSADARSFWEEMRAQYSKVYAQELILSAPRKKFLPKQHGTSVFIVTDQELRRPKEWRYILWENFGPDAVISAAPMDPRYWRARVDDSAVQIVKHRIRSTLLNAIGENIGVIRCENEECFSYGNIDSVARLDAMLHFGAEHRIDTLTNRGFAPEMRDPKLVQPIISNPEPAKSWGWYG